MSYPEVPANDGCHTGGAGGLIGQLSLLRGSHNRTSVPATVG